MTNKREFKKYITAVSTAVSQEMMDALYSIDGVDQNAIQDAVIDVLKAGELAIMKSNVKFDKSPKAFPSGGYSQARYNFFKMLYKKTNTEFADAINAAIKKFNAAVPSNVKEGNKSNA